MTTVKPKPILFSPPMVRAILDGRKSQTRRVVKEVPRDAASISEAGYDAGDRRWAWFDAKSTIIGSRFACRYGVPGDRLWVKETWRPFWHPELFCSVQYAADSSYRKPDFDGEERGHRFADLCEASGDNAEPWHPSIHMWREMSRITLEVVSVRVERVEAITEADAIAEGFAPSRERVGNGINWESARAAFLHTVYDLNKRAPRGSNPWVWVIAFERCEKPGGPNA